MSASLSLVAGLWAALLGRSSGSSDGSRSSGLENSWAASWIAGDAHSSSNSSGPYAAMLSSWLLIWMVAILGFLGLGELESRSTSQEEEDGRTVGTRLEHAPALSSSSRQTMAFHAFPSFRGRERKARARRYDTRRAVKLLKYETVHNP